MDVRVRERMVGALVLVATVVLLVPAVLQGPQVARDSPPAGKNNDFVVPVGDADAPPKDERLIPEPALHPVPALPPPIEPPPVREIAKPAADTTAAPADAPIAIKPAAQPPPARGAATTPVWAVQLGAFSTREKAESLVAELRKRGYSAFVLEYRATGQVLHRVRVGPEQDRARAVAIADRLRKDGFQPVVAPHP